MVVKTMLIKKKQSVYLDDDLRRLITNELKNVHDQGYLDISVSSIIKKRLRDSYQIPMATENVK